jgi:hypothetical protein
MSGRGVSSRRAIEKLAEGPELSGQPGSAAGPEMDREAELAEERGAERLRARLREMLEERRRVVRLGDQQIEVVEVTAIEDVLSEDNAEPGDQPIDGRDD